ncbi:MAG: hypothetical protein KGY53_13170 [Wenzhouxiangellaceae bacterium]|nr:hypothetical protein [Wenzhouxiangellaceae bacterium]MBS3824836.1 hypothetical protein [Wenzhouxiangellaceae bacterium]
MTEIAEAQALAEPIFQRKYRAPAPPASHGHHILALVRTLDRAWVAASYLNYLPFENAMLIGGACTDGAVLGGLPESRRAQIRSAGGLMLQTVRYGEARFAERSIATFGHCGDDRSWAVLSRCGYQRLDHPHLIVRWNREPKPLVRSELIRKVDALGAF